MKKSIILLFIICLIPFILISCDNETFQMKPNDSTETETQTETEAETETETETEQFTKQELDILKVSDNELTEKFGITDFSVFRITVNQFGTGKISVSYALLLEGIFTEEQYFVLLDDDLNIIESSSSNVGKYSKYLNDDGFKTAFYAAKSKIDEEAASYGEIPHYYFVEKDGYLCLSCELIIDIAPPEDQTGEFIEGGCGIDHDHIFFTEQICKIDP